MYIIVQGFYLVRIVKQHSLSHKEIAKEKLIQQRMK